MRIAVNSLLEDKPVSIDNSSALPGLLPFTTMSLIMIEHTFNNSKQLIASRKAIREASLFALFAFVALFMAGLGLSWASFFVSVSAACLLSIIFPPFIEEYVLGLETREVFSELFKADGFRGLAQFPFGLLNRIASDDLPLLETGIRRLIMQTEEERVTVTPHPCFVLGFMMFYHLRFFVDYIPFARYYHFNFFYSNLKRPMNLSLLPLELFFLASYCLQPSFIFKKSIKTATHFWASLPRPEGRFFLFLCFNYKAYDPEKDPLYGLVKKQKEVASGDSHLLELLPKLPIELQQECREAIHSKTVG